MEDLKNCYNPIKTTYCLKSHGPDGILKNQYKLLAKAIIMENNRVRNSQEDGTTGYIKYIDCVRLAQELGVNFVCYKQKTDSFAQVNDAITKRAMRNAQTKYVQFFRSKHSYTYESLREQHTVPEMLDFLNQPMGKIVFKRKDIFEMENVLRDLSSEEYTKSQKRKANDLLNLIWARKLFNPFLPPVYGKKEKDVEGWGELDGLLKNT